MKSLESRVQKMEEKLSALTSPTTPEFVIVFVSTFDFVEAGYFESVEEQEAFQQWRIEQIKRENTGAGFITFGLEKADITQNIALFRNNKAVSLTA